MAEERSNNPRLVLLPGMDGTGWLLEPFAAALPASLRPFIVRYPPTGCTSYAEVGKFLHSAGIDSEPFVLLAESYSSVAAITFAAANPPNLKGLIICAGFATPPVRPLLRPISALLTHVLFAIPRPSIVTRRWTAGTDAPGELIQKLKRVKTTIPVETFAARIRAILNCDARADLAKVRVPILFLHAKDDWLVDTALLEEMRALQPAAEVEIIPGPHLLLERHPKEAAERVARFIRDRVR
jgi:pimeloyl-ACP methyl ester carboxylesterase